MMMEHVFSRRNVKVLTLLAVACVLVAWVSIANVNDDLSREYSFGSNSEKNEVVESKLILPKEKSGIFNGTDQSIGDKQNSKLSVKEKELKEAELVASKTEVITQIALYESLIRRGAEVDPDMALRMKNNAMTAADWDTIDIYAASLLSAEENFKIELSQYKNFEQLKKAFEKRAGETGLFYGTELLNESNTYKGITFDEVKSLIDSGASLPEDFLSKAAYANNLDLAVKLKAAGYNFNSDFIDSYKWRNAIEAQVESYAINPFGSSAGEQLNNIRKLIDLGVPLKVSDGTRDPLDFALQGVFNHDGAEAESLMLLAKNIHTLGIGLEDSSYELLEKIKNKNPLLYEQYIESFK